MEQFIIQLGYMSIQAVVVILAVLLVRVAFAGAHVPKKYANWLWFLTYIVMICPWKISSAFSFWRMPKGYRGDRIEAGAQEVQQTLTQIIVGEVPADVIDGVGGNTGIVGSQAMEKVTDTLVAGTENMESVVNHVTNGSSTTMSLADVLGVVWILGVIVFLIYSVISYVKLRKKVICSVKLQDNIYYADDIYTAFVLGVIRPKIYLPSGLKGETLEYVLAHEKTHIKRLDPLKKVLAFGITVVHWFNPFAWVAFYFFCKDMEMACDEETVLRIGMEKKQDYATALLQLSAERSFLPGAPLAFGENGVKARIRNITGFKKVWVVVSVVAVLVIAVLAMGFMSKYEDSTTLERLKDEVGVIDWAENAEPIWLTIDGEKILFEEAYYDSFVEFFNKLEVTKEPISPSRADDRPKDVVLRVGTSHYNIYNGTYIYIGNDYKEIWFDDGVKPSLSYGIINPQQVIDFLNSQEGSVVKATEQEMPVPPEPAPEATPEPTAPQDAENGDEWSKVYPWADLDGDGTEEYILIERGGFLNQNTIYGRITVYVNNEPVYQYTEDLWITGVDQMEYLDLDGDGQEEIFVSFAPAVNSMPLIEWFVLKQVEDGWKLLEMHHNSENMLDNAFPITVVLKKGQFGFGIRCEGWDGEIDYDATARYERLKEEEEEWGNYAYSNYMDANHEIGDVVGGPMAYGIWNIQLGTFEGRNCLVAEHCLGGWWDKFDDYGLAYVYFDYDEEGKIRILDMTFEEIVY